MEARNSSKGLFGDIPEGFFVSMPEGPQRLILGHLSDTDARALLRTCKHFCLLANIMFGKRYADYEMLLDYTNKGPLSIDVSGVRKPWGWSGDILKSLWLNSINTVNLLLGLTQMGIKLVAITNICALAFIRESERYNDIEVIYDRNSDLKDPEVQHKVIMALHNTEQIAFLAAESLKMARLTKHMPNLYHLHIHTYTCITYARKIDVIMPNITRLNVSTISGSPLVKLAKYFPSVVRLYLELSIENGRSLYELRFFKNLQDVHINKVIYRQGRPIAPILKDRSGYWEKAGKLKRLSLPQNCNSIGIWREQYGHIFKEIIIQEENMHAPSSRN